MERICCFYDQLRDRNLLDDYTKNKNKNLKPWTAYNDHDENVLQDLGCMFVLLSIRYLKTPKFTPDRTTDYQERNLPVCDLEQIISPVHPCIGEYFI